MSLSIQSSTFERLAQDLTSSGDPTGVAPDWAFLACESPKADPENADYSAGQWDPSGWNSVTKRATAETPIVGGTGTGATIELADGQYVAWVRFTVGSEVVVRKAGILTVRSG